METQVPTDDPAFEALFRSTERPSVRVREVRRLLLDSGGLRDSFDRAFRHKERYGFAVLQAVQLEGHDVMMQQQAWGLFNPTRSVELSALAFERLRADRTSERLRSRLESVAATLGEAPETPSELRGDGLPDSLVLALFPADPAHLNLMVTNAGLSVFGSVPGYLVVQVWPSQGNLERLEAEVVRELLKGRHWAVHGPPETLGDFLRAENEVGGRLEELGLLPEWVLAPCTLGVQSPPDHEDALQEIAEHYEVSSYDHVDTNVYGSRLRGGDRLPEVVPLSSEDLEYSVEVLRGALEQRDPRAIAAHLYGDAAVQRLGHRGVGLSPWAGLCCASRLSDLAARSS